MYYTLYETINNYVFGGLAQSGSIEADCITLLSLVLVCAVVYLPFRVMIRAVEFIVGGLR